jgi:hypothetical protein
MGERDMNEWLVSGSGIGLGYDHYGRKPVAAPGRMQGLLTTEAV